GALRHRFAARLRPRPGGAASAPGAHRAAAPPRRHRTGPPAGAGRGAAPRRGRHAGAGRRADLRARGRRAAAAGRPHRPYRPGRPAPAGHAGATAGRPRPPVPLRPARGADLPRSGAPARPRRVTPLSPAARRGPLAPVKYQRKFVWRRASHTTPPPGGRAMKAYGGRSIGSARRPAAGPDVIEGVNAADEQLIATVPAGTVEDVDAAVRAARAALPAWSATPPAERAARLAALRDVLQARREEIAETVTAELGSPLKLSQTVHAGVPVAVARSEEHTS